ncbi:MAG: amidohydrolase [Chloroflexi bacterium]|nr:amidohydrolase [Chloroflexota bacterium]
MDYTTISADAHIDIPWLPADLFVSNAPERFKEHMPRVEETEQGRVWKVDGQLLGWVAGAGLKETWEPYVPGLSKHMDQMAETGFFTDGDRGLFHPTTPELRIGDQDLDGIQGEVIYGILGLGGGFPVAGGQYGITDADRTVILYDIYNEWLADFCKTRPGRFAGLACLTSHDPEVAAGQLRKAADMGLRGGELNVSQAAKPIYHEDWDTLWAASDEYQMPVSFHTLGITYRKPDPGDAKKFEWVDFGLTLTLFQLSGAEFLGSVIFGGACDRSPGFKFILGECGIGWIPYMLYRMDEEYKETLFHLNLSMDPSELWHRQGFSTFQHENPSAETVQKIGEDNIMWGSDYPHHDGVWPNSQKVIQDDLGHLAPSARRKITCDNAARLYRFEQTSTSHSTQ